MDFRPQTVEKGGENYSSEILLTVIPYGLASGLVILRGCVQTNENRPQAGCQVPVTAPTGHKTQVIEQDDEGTQAEPAEQDIEHPLGAVLLELGDGRGVAAARRRSIVCSMNLGRVDVPALWSYASARFLLLCHEVQCRTPAPLRVLQLKSLFLFTHHSAGGCSQNSLINCTASSRVSPAICSFERCKVCTN